MTTIAEVKAAQAAAEAQVTVAQQDLDALTKEKAKATALGLKNDAVGAASSAWEKFAAAFKGAYVDVDTPEARDAVEAARRAATTAESLARQAVELYKLKFA
ncbi:MAG TPA: hypothetical protein VMT29_06070 [Steroidobacteraceae bacterium]|nr:hypothetical protein [Steroidobacteraceae bacterium]